MKERGAGRYTAHEEILVGRLMKAGLRQDFFEKLIGARLVEFASVCFAKRALSS